MTPGVKKKTLETYNDAKGHRFVLLCNYCIGKTIKALTTRPILLYRKNLALSDIRWMIDYIQEGIIIRHWGGIPGLAIAPSVFVVCM